MKSVSFILALHGNKKHAKDLKYNVLCSSYTAAKMYKYYPIAH